MTTVYNPLSATFRERSERLEASAAAATAAIPCSSHSGFWLRQRSQDGQSIINAATSRQQGAELVRRDASSRSTTPTAISAASKPSARRCTTAIWRLEDARVYAGEALPTNHKSYDLKTNLTRAQVQEIVRDARNRPVLATVVR